MTFSSQHENLWTASTSGRKVCIFSLQKDPCRHLSMYDQFLTFERFLVLYALFPVFLISSIKISWYMFFHFRMSRSWGEIVSEEEREERMRGERERTRDEEERRRIRSERRERLGRRERRNGRSTGDLRDRLLTNCEFQEPFINRIMSPIMIY